jgi:DnaD/phage-associated family protein
MSFHGFPARMQFTPVPNAFINQLAPDLSQEELRLMLGVFNILYNKKGYPRHITVADIAAQPAAARLDSTRIKELLDAACRKEMLLALEVSGEGQAIYFLNAPADRQAMEKVKSGEVKLAGISPARQAAAPEAPPDIFTLYEENIGLITPMIAEELKDALNTYPEEWIRQAVREAVNLNKRNWRYILRILERWTAEGKDNGTHRPDTERDKYVSGRYGGLVQR